MTIAIPTLRGKLSPHFGHCRKFTFVQVNGTGEVEKTEDKTRTIELPKRKIGFFDVFAFGFTGLGFIFLLAFSIFGAETIMDVVFLTVFSIILVWLTLGIMKSLTTIGEIQISSHSIEIGSSYRGKLRKTHLEKAEIKSIELKPLAFFSIYTKSYNYILALRIFASFGQYRVPTIDCGSSYVFIAEFHDSKTRKWITEELKKEMNYSP